MTDQPSQEKGFANFHLLAEKQGKARRPRNSPATSSHDSQLLVHKMHVHQIELEMQNEELRVAQEQLGELLKKYSDLYEFAPVGYVTSNRYGRIMEANLTFAGQLGAERGRLINSALSLHAIEPDRPTFRAHLEQVFTSNERQTCELHLESRNGPERYVQLDSVRVLHADGTPLCRTSITDISARKKGEDERTMLHAALEKRLGACTKALSESGNTCNQLLQEFRTLLSAISETVVLLSPKMEIVWINGETTLEWSKATADPARQYCAKLHDRAALREDCPVSRCFATGHKEVGVVTDSGYVLDIRAFPIREADKVISVLLVISDITEKTAMQAEVIQAAQLASLGEVAAGVAHEINNPITGIINYGQILINECSPESLEKDIGTRIVKEGERVGRIVTTLLSYAQHDRRKEKRSSSLPAILAESIVLTQAQIRKEGITLTIDVPEELPSVEVDFQQIQQCIINIINNACYALNEKYPGRHANKRLEITGRRVVINKQPWVHLIFHDQGVGIAAPELAVVTDPFFSTKPFGKGTGLGLNITQKIIADHGGSLRFESVKGEFTKVIIALPAQQSHAQGEI